MHRRRRVDLKRSKRGCMTCRVRRKKCPEDFQQWPDGTYGCSTCSHRGQPCELAQLTMLSGTPSSSNNNSSNIIHSGSGGIGRTVSSNSIPSSHFGRTGSLISSSSSMSLEHESGTPISSISASPSLASRPKPSSMQPPPSPHHHQPHPRYSESSSSMMGPPYSHTKPHTPIEFLSPAEILRRADSTMPSFSYPHQRSSSSSTHTSSRPQATSLLPPPHRTGSEVTPAKSPAQSGLDQDSNTRNWLDTFFGEFMQLTEPSLQRIQGTAAAQEDQHSLAFSPTDIGPMAGGAADATHPSSSRPHNRSSSLTIQASHGQAASQSDPSPANSMSSPAFPWSDSVIDQAVRLDDLDELLIRWSPIYETYLGAIVDDSKRSDGGSLLDQLMEITKSCNICKASMVACCLAYRDLIARELQSTRPISRIVKYLLGSETQNTPTTTSSTTASATAKDAFNHNNTNKGSTPSANSTDSGSKSSATYASRYAHAWLKFALDGFNRISATMPLATKMLSLLNIRYSTICLQGGREMVPLMNELQMLMAEISVDVGYLYNTCNSGTTLAFMAQALAFANVMDHAALSGVRPAVANKCHSAVLTEDAMTRPHATYQYMTALSVGLLECIKRITDLSADIKGGLVYDRADIEARSEQIKTLILSSEITLPSDLGKANSRMRTFGLHELWRQAVLIQLYQDVHHLGPMASRLQEVLSQMFILTEILSTTERDTERGSDRADVWDMSYVYFLACTVAVKDQHRSVFLGHLESLGCEKAILDNVDCVKTLWRVMDETGRATDWREVMADNDLYPCYTF